MKLYETNQIKSNQSTVRYCNAHSGNSQVFQSSPPFRIHVHEPDNEKKREISERIESNDTVDHIILLRRNKALVQPVPGLFIYFFSIGNMSHQKI